jgi:hypothetical protein
MRFDLHAHNIRVSQVSPGHVKERNLPSTALTATQIAPKSTKISSP